MYSNRLNAEGCTRLADSLRKNKALKRLDLRFNNMGPKAATAMAEVLRVKNRTLAMLNVASNDIQPEGVTQLANVLEHNTILQRLHMGYNGQGNALRADLRLFKLVNRRRTTYECVSRRRIRPGSSRAPSCQQLPMPGSH